MTLIPPPRVIDNGYPTIARFPMPETDWHRILMCTLIDTLIRHFAGQRVYTSGNLLLFYEEGNRRRHVSPDVFVVRGIDHYPRPNYLVWDEGKAPEFVIELTSSTTRTNDLTTKRDLYRDVLRVKEYFLFDPFGDYLEPRLQGYRLRGEQYVAIRPRDGRLPSRITGLHLERSGDDLRLWNPATNAWLPTNNELIDQQQQQIAALQKNSLQEQLVAQQTQMEAMQQQIAALQAQLNARGQPSNGNGAHGL
jgi:Uma2 family endonuclease